MYYLSRDLGDFASWTRSREQQFENISASEVEGSMGRIMERSATEILWHAVARYLIRGEPASQGVPPVRSVLVRMGGLKLCSKVGCVGSDRGVCNARVCQAI